MVLCHVRGRSGELEVAKLNVHGQTMSVESTAGERHAFDLRCLRRAIALKEDVYAGIQVTLLLKFAGPQSLLRIPESCESWQETCVALETVVNSIPYGMWYAQLLALREGSAIEIYKLAVPECNRCECIVCSSIMCR